MKGIAIVIVTRNSGEVILPCLDACLPWATEVIVIDNASEDDTAERVRQRPAVKLIANASNEGFAGGVNQGVELSRQPLILLLNPDAQLTSGLTALARACLPSDVGAAAGQLNDAGGKFQLGFSFRRLPRARDLVLESLGINRLWRSNPANRHYRCLDYDPNQPADVEQPAAAFLMLRRDVWEQLGGLDERFHPVWFEDVDYCKRLKDRGFRVRYEPASTARHVGGHSASALDPGTRAVYWYGSLLEYAGKHFPRYAVRAVCLAVILGAGARIVIGIVTTRRLSLFSSYSNIVGQSIRALIHPAGGADSSSCFRRTPQAQIHVL